MSKNITTFIIPKMDCPCEEQMIKLTLSTLNISKMDFDKKFRYSRYLFY